MLNGIKELVDLLLLWGFMYVGSFLLLIVAIVYITKTNPTPPTPIIHEHKIVQNIIQPLKRVLVEREVCKDVRGCELLKGGECPDCVLEKIYE
jgi:hypothetical protein|tara:strand:- start:321 stop:599 length:279 start_codon:yes stop_codon:yes gene_type:complete